MSRRINLTNDAARRIVKAGTEERIDLTQRTRRLNKRNKSNLHGVLTGHISARNDTVYTFSDGRKEIKCYAPLLQEGSVINVGTGVIIARDRDGWVIIAAECEN